MEKLIVVLIAAHLLGDFLCQPDWLIERKKKFPFLLLHGLIHALLVYVLYQAWASWQLPVVILAVHLAIDLAKQRSKSDSAKAFAWDQGAHIFSLIGIGWLFTEMGWQPAFSGQGYSLMVGVAGFVATTLGAGYFVGKVATTLKEQNDLKICGLLNGGEWIGNLERALIYLLIFVGQPTGIGFLVAAKSILRFHDTKEQRHTEYVLIGTLLSFSLAIALATATNWAMRL
ncbi:MAG: DUF3307 domain-containing protein [Candidatus Poribacteria bacterium]|nr:DUF3307 domain-containing protein [Candidatus Poribacteria bacterium]